MRRGFTLVGVAFVNRDTHRVWSYRFVTSTTVKWTIAIDGATSHVHPAHARLGCLERLGVDPAFDARLKPTPPTRTSTVVSFPDLLREDAVATSRRDRGDTGRSALAFEPR